MTDPHVDALIRATGLVTALIGSLFEQARLLPPGEFEGHLAILARVATETDPKAGRILEDWAAMASRNAGRTVS